MYHNIFIVYTQEAETADSYIERVTYELRGRKRVRVATSDNLEQLIILGARRVARVSAKSFHDEVADQTQQEIERISRAEQSEKSIVRYRRCAKRAYRRFFCACRE